MAEKNAVGWVSWMRGWMQERGKGLSGAGAWGDRRGGLSPPSLAVLGDRRLLSLKRRGLLLVLSAARDLKTLGTRLGLKPRLG